MTDFDPKLDVRVAGNDITVTLLGTRYSVTYFKRRGSPGLFAKDIVHGDDPRVPMTSAEFLAKAGRLQTKRRESWAGSFEGQFEPKWLIPSVTIH
jgi:hypothetical protein